MYSALSNNGEVVILNLTARIMSTCTVPLTLEDVMKWLMSVDTASMTCLHVGLRPVTLCNIVNLLISAIALNVIWLRIMHILLFLSMVSVLT